MLTITLLNASSFAVSNKIQICTAKPLSTTTQARRREAFQRLRCSSSAQKEGQRQQRNQQSAGGATERCADY